MDAGPGHNLPPSDESVFLGELEARHAELLDRRKSLLDAAERVPDTIEDAETADKTANFIKQLTAHEKKADKARTDEKSPYLERGRWIDGYFKTTAVAGVADLKRTVTARLTAYQRKVAEAERRRRLEKERQEREEAERKRQVAEEAARAAQTDEDLNAAVQAEQEAAEAAERAERAARDAEANAADLSRQHTSAGAVASLRTTWECTAYDPHTVDLEALRSHFAQADIEKAIRAYIRAGKRNLRGATIEAIQTARVA